MAIDYQSYGFSGSGSDDLKLLEADPTTDAQVLADKRLRVVVKRTNLNNAHEVDDYRAAISYLQGEPGVDPDSIGIWGSSNAGSVVIAVAAIDARAKAVVSQVAGPRPAPRGPAPAPTAAQAAMVDDAIKRARTGQGAEVDGGFSFKSKIDLFGNFRNRDIRAGSTLDQIAETTKILFLPAEKDELTGGAGGRAGGDPVSERPRRHGADHRLSGADTLSGVLEHRLRRRLDPRSGMVPEVSGSASFREAIDGCAGAEVTATLVDRHENTLRLAQGSRLS